MSTHCKNLMKLFSEVNPRHSSWEVFQDFIGMSAISLSNAIDRTKTREERESRYMEMVKKYEKKDIDIFPKMFGELVMAMESEPGDILGRIYCELGLANKWTGQFFTPDCVSRMMGKIAMGDIQAQIEEKGFITVQEPCIGGGAMIINLALAMKEEGINYQQAMLVTGIDVDIKSIYMAYTQLALMHVPAILVHGNSLTMEVFETWYTPAYIMGGWAFKRQKERKEKLAPVFELPKVPVIEEIKKVESYELISLFG